MVLDVAGREVTVSNPDKVYFPRTGHTKLDLVRYYLAVADGALRGVAERPMALKRFVNGAEGESFFQKRAPEKRPEWIETVELKFPSGRSAHEIVVRDAAQLAWVVNLGCIDLNPHPVRADDLDHPDELRVDLDPMPGVPWSDVLQVALVAREVLEDFGLTGWPKTSGSRGFHVYCRIQRRWTFPEVRRAAVALAREVERRAPEIATSKWWKEERHGVFVDYNQNAKDRTVASAYSVRPVPDAAGVDAAGLGRGAGLPAGGVHPRHRARAGRRGGRRRGRASTATPGRWRRCWSWPTSTRRPASPTPPGRPISSRPRASRPGPSRPSGAQPEPGAREGFVPPPAPGKTAGPTGRRRTTMPLIEVARAATEAEAREGLERWKARHGDVWPLLGPTDVLVDSMRGRSTTWYRIRLNLRNVPEDSRPPQEALEVDYDPWGGRPAGR